jgi:hypothetical protein
VHGDGNWFPGECAHIPGQNVTLFVYLDPARDWVAGARKHFSSEWLFEDDSPHSLEEAKKIVTEWGTEESPDEIDLQLRTRFSVA